MVAPLVVSSILSVGKALIDRLIPDPAAKAEATYKLLEMEQRGELAQLNAEIALATGQLEINKVEAANANPFVSGWRPAVGWVCVLGLVYNYLGWPLLAWYSSSHLMPAPPSPELGDLIILLGGMLGFGGLRSFDKKVGTSK